MIHHRPTIVAASIFLTGCSGPTVDGLFNNERRERTSLEEHAEAWRRQIGRVVDRKHLETIMRRHNGDCSREADLTICVVNVRARSPVIFTQRHMWTIKLEPEGRLCSKSVRPSAAR